MSGGSREGKKAKRDRDNADRLERRRRRLSELLRNLGYDGASKSLLDALLDRRYPVPNVVLSPLASESVAGLDLASTILAALAESSVALAPQGAQVSLPVFFADYLSIADGCRAELHARGNAGPRWTTFAQRIAPHRDENLKCALRALASKVDETLLPNCDFSENIYFAHYGFEPSPLHPGKQRMTIVVDVHRAHPVTFERDQKPRPAWRCGLPLLHRGIEWVRWSRTTPGFGRELPEGDVYLQGHALQRLKERLCCFAPSSLTDWVWQSLRKPVLLQQESGWLVEFRVWQWRLGYFCAEEVDGKVLVTTFLFLTNAGTPEGKLLRERTRFTTNQIEWLKMDILSYFLLSDVQSDPELRALFAECGCGHLFEMMKPEARTSTLRMAGETRRHLWMPPSA